MPTRTPTKRKGRMSREDAGRKGAEARWGKTTSRSQLSSSNRTHPRMSRENERQSSETRMGRQGMERYSDYEGQKGCRRCMCQEAGRREAEARWAMKENYENRPERMRRGDWSGYEYQDEPNFGRQRRMGHEDAGRRGAAGRWEYDYEAENERRNPQFNLGRERLSNYEENQMRNYPSNFEDEDPQIMKGATGILKANMDMTQKKMKNINGHQEDGNIKSK